MLERTTVYVDTSYLLASFYNSWEEGAREQLEVSLSNVVHTLDRISKSQSRQPVHRQFWYDGVPDSGPHRYQRTLRVIDGVILRTGQLIEWGNRRSQKAVDTRLVADMVIAAHRQQCTDMVLVSGDADMIPGVEAAVEAGVRVHLVGFGWDSVSSALRNACDTSLMLDPRSDFADSMQIRVLEGPLPPQVKHPRPNPNGEPGHEDGGEEEFKESVDIEDVDFQPERARDESVAGAHGKGKVPAPDDTVPVAPNDGAAGEGAAEPDAGDGDTAENAESSELGEGATSTPSSAGMTASQPGSAQWPGGSERDGADAGASQPAHDRDSAPETPDRIDDADVAEDDDPAGPGPGEVVERAYAGGAAGASDGSERVTETADASEVSDVRQSEYAGQDGSHRGRTTVTVTRRSVTVTARAERARMSAGDERDGSGDEDSPRPNPGMMAARRRPMRSRYVPLTEEVWSSSGEASPYDVGQQYATWWYQHAADDEQRQKAHTLTGGALPPEIDRPLLQFACQMLHEFTLNEFQRVALRDGFHEGIRGIVMQR
ncbi:MAG TPA: NYN domain-containing protein [Dietzia timorensis]|uniref:NYN domain-containing protein n=1 Tax=Dietzia timorensis TaxID=499555 RepID=A0A921F710_9ACTN|nr:NYN domain-containing protein [Dietzia timorensis]HJE91274.1 NYN domain-containing protein [Dietzia timorensis]